MNRKAEIVARARGLAAEGGPLSPSDVWALGRLLRVAGSDVESDEEAALVDEAGSLATALLSRDRAVVELPTGDAVRAHLAAPAGPVGAAADEVDRLGALAAVLLGAAPSSLEAARAVDLGRTLAASVGVADALALLPLAEAVSRRVSEEGVVSEAEPLTLALTDVLGAALGRALGGEALSAPRPRVALDEPASAALASVLARALGKVSFAAPAELFDVFVPAVHREAALTLHEATPRAPEQTLVVFGGVEVTVGPGEIRVVVPQGPTRDAPILVCIERGHPGEACPSRGGATARETVFTLPTSRRDLDGFALVLGDRVAFLRRP